MKSVAVYQLEKHSRSRATVNPWLNSYRHDCKLIRKFDYGPIAEIEGNKLEIDFEQAGRKRVMDSFVSVE